MTMQVLQDIQQAPIKFLLKIPMDKNHVVWRLLLLVAEALLLRVAVAGVVADASSTVTLI